MRKSKEGGRSEFRAKERGEKKEGRMDSSIGGEGGILIIKKRRRRSGKVALEGEKGVN